MRREPRRRALDLGATPAQEGKQAVEHEEQADPAQGCHVDGSLAGEPTNQPLRWWQQLGRLDRAAPQHQIEAKQRLGGEDQPEARQKRSWPPPMRPARAPVTLIFVTWHDLL